jgi:hypothetical protein
MFNNCNNKYMVTALYLLIVSFVNATVEAILSNDATIVHASSARCASDPMSSVKFP